MSLLTILFLSTFAYNQGGFVFAGIQSLQQPPSQDFPNAYLFAHSTGSAQPLLLKMKLQPLKLILTLLKFSLTHTLTDELYDPIDVIPTSDCDQFNTRSRAFIVHDAQHQHLSKKSPILMMIIRL
jgi:hypothetical protein